MLQKLGGLDEVAALAAVLRAYTSPQRNSKMQFCSASQFKIFTSQMAIWRKHFYVPLSVCNVQAAKLLNQNQSSFEACFGNPECTVHCWQLCICLCSVKCQHGLCKRINKTWDVAPAWPKQVLWLKNSTIAAQSHIAQQCRNIRQRHSCQVVKCSFVCHA